MRAITDSSGAVVAHSEYGAWRELLGLSLPFSGGFAYLFVGAWGVRFDPRQDRDGLVRALARHSASSLQHSSTR